MKSHATLLVAAFATSLIAGCAVSADPAPTAAASPEAAREDFNGGISGLQDEFGKEGKADLFGVDVCHYIAPLFKDGHNYTHAGFFAGVEGEGVVGFGSAFSGYDLVWDMYHHQMAVSRYTGAGLGTPGAGASVEAYAGFATGFEHGVNGWDGYFVTAELELGFPFLKDYLSLNPAAFVTGVDRNKDGVIGPTEVLMPPDGVYGFQVGVSLGFDLLPDALPVGGSVSEGLWVPYKPAIRYYYDKFRSTHFVKLGSALDVHLVEPETGEACNPNWPDEDGEAECVIQFGEPDWGHAHRGLHVAYSICSALGGCDIPLSWPMSATAVAIGAYRDVGESVAELCPDLPQSTEHHH